MYKFKILQHFYTSSIKKTLYSGYLGYNYSMKNIDVAIIGAGASGMVTAILLAREGFRVLLVEKQKAGGKKILASGNGRCNISNIKISKSNFHGANRVLIDTLLKEYNLNDIKKFFKSIGQDLIETDSNRLFPASMQASSVLELLNAEIKRLNIEVIYEAKDTVIEKNLSIAIDKKIYKAKNLVVSTGSPAAPQLGGNNSGIEIASTFKHTTIEPLPALVSLYSNSPICKKATGVKIDINLKLFVDNQETTSKSGDLLFTKYGISGLSVLDISIDITKAIRANKNYHLEIDFFPNLNKKELLEFLKSRIDKKRELPLNLWLSAILNSKISDHLLKELNLIDKTEKQLNNSNLKLLVEKVKRYKIEIDKLREFKYAEVASGGVNSNEVDISMQSKKVKNLYFTGEVLDIVGDRGGYNFTFAWFSAFRAANSIISKSLH